MTLSKKSTSKTGSPFRIRAIGAAALFLAAAPMAGCGKPRAAKPAPPPQPAFVRLQSLTEAHPLTPSLRELDATEERLRRDNAARSAATPDRVAFAPLAPQSVNATDTRRNVGARDSLRRNAEITLSRYIAALRKTNERIGAEKRSELEGIARARNAVSEAEARARIENDTRLAIAGRSDAARAARIRRNAARLNLSNNNLVSVARDPETKLPSEKRLEEQVAVLQEREKNPPPPSDKPFYISDEARVTKLLRDLEAELAGIRAANDRDTAFNNGLIADAIATIRSDNANWVEEELASMPNRDRSLAELSAIRRELAGLLLNLQRTEQLTRANITRVAGRDSDALPPITPVTTSSAVSSDLSRRLSEERARIRGAIRRDILAAVRDAGLAHNVKPVFASASNLPDRTDDFSRWIFGNVDATTLSNQSAPQ